MDFLNELFAKLTNAWLGWDTTYRLLAVGVAAVLAYLIIRALPPLVRFVLIAALVIAVVWVLFPGKICTLPWISTLQALCAH